MMKRKLTEDEPDDDSQIKSTSNVSSKSNKKSKLFDRDFTSGEITKLKETEALYHSSLFRLQLSELLKEVSVKQKMKSRLEEVCDYLIDVLKNLPKGKEHKITDKKWLKSRGIKIPILERPSQVKGTFEFMSPIDVHLSGSFVLDTSVMPDIQADLVMVVPKAFFQPKDYLNQRYTRKRALYLCAIASHLDKLKRVEDLRFTYFMGNPHKPVLVVKIKGQDEKSVQICLQAVPESDSFKMSRFHVSKNNIRPVWYQGKQETAEDVNDSESLPATPFYSSSVLNDICLLTNDAFVQKLVSGSEGVRDGIKLLKVWLHQREILKGPCAFSSFLMTCYVANLIMTKKVNKLMNSYQVFRTTLLYLSKSDWVTDPPSLYEDPPQKTQPTVDQFKEAGSCVFIDRTGFYNLAYALPLFTFIRVKHEAQLSIDALEQHSQSSFDALFMIPVTFARKFDHIFHLTLKGDLAQQPLQKIEGLEAQVMDIGGVVRLPLAQRIVNILTDALGKRAVLVHPKISRPVQWSTSEDAYDLDAECPITFGISIDTANAFGILDKGPSAESAESRDFRSFWGDKSEMRRFKDGTIHEAVLWTDSTCQSDRRLVCQKVVQHVLQRHCNIPSRCVHYMEGKLDPLLHLNLLPKETDMTYGTGEEQSLAVHHAFDHLTKAVRSLTSLPLSIHSIQGTHSIFRHTCVFPPLPAPLTLSDVDVVDGHMVPKEGKTLPQHVPALEVICLLEGSGKWPEEVEAIKCLKSLLHVKMGTELKEKHALPTSIHKEYVDVLKDRFVFRLKIANTRELAVLRTVKTESGMVKFKDTDKCLALEKEIVDLPRLTHHLHSIQQEHPVFSVTARLCKRWVAAQMASGLMSEEAVELLVAYLFTSSHPYTVPGSPNAGLLRFLHLLSNFNWKADPLMVNLNKDFTDEDFTTIVKEFQKNRAGLPCMCICTPSDKQGSKWTRQLPTEAFLQRLIILARESLLVLDAQLMKNSDVTDFKMIFRAPLQHFDLVIHLIKRANVLQHQGVDEKHDIFINTAKFEKDKSQPAFPVVNFCVFSKFFEDVQNVFGDYAMFFHDPLGGNVIGMVWKSSAIERKDYKAVNFRYRKPSVDETDKASLEAVKELILDDIRVMGGGIVESIVDPKSATS